jgi:superfamily II DNA helicase RecQ
MLVIPESAVSNSFITFLNQLKITKRLDRIVINKYHIILNRHFIFRKQIQQLGKLAIAETQIVLLTATLPLSEEDELFQWLYIEQEDIFIFQARTTRRNIAYQVMDISGLK